MFEAMKGPYSREEYDDVKKQADELEPPAKDYEKKVDGMDKAFNEEFYKGYQNPLNVIMARPLFAAYKAIDKLRHGQDKIAYDKAMKQLAAMRNWSEDEAYKINEEYDALLARAQQANEDVYNFQTKFLGMHEQEIPETDAETAETEVGS